MKRILTTLLLVAMLLSTFAMVACGGGGTVVDDLDLTGIYDGSAVTITFWHTMGADNKALLEDAIARFNEYNSTYGYIDGYDGSGSMFFGTIATAIIALCIFTDRKEDELYESRHMQIMRWIVIMTCFIQVVFIVTSMYIGFNAVGSRQILGSQFRYLFPLMCPLFFFMRPKCSRNYFSTKNYEALVFGGLTFNLFIGYLLTYLIYI